MGKGLAWMQEEINFLEENWGKRKVSTLSKQLNRSENGIVLKAKRLGLGPSKENQGLLNANQLAVALGVDRHAITDYWIEKCGLRAVRKVTKELFKFWSINIDDFWKWAKDNQDKFDTRRFEQLLLGPEPAWMKDKRRLDRSLPVRRFQKWTAKEDERLRTLFKCGLYTYKQIGELMGRSNESVERRASRIDVWGIGKCLQAK
jgi:hypothetical protein